MSGLFITFEGGEGAGKSTQARALVDALDARGIDAVLTREPGGSEGAEQVRRLLLGGASGRWGPRAETLLFAAARADHLEKLIRPALAAGKWVICDRFLDSTRAYQGASGIDDAAILAMHRFGADGLMPDRTILLAVDPATGIERATRRDAGQADRFSARDAAFHARVAARFDAIALEEGERVRRVDARADAETVTDRVIRALADLLPA